MGNKQVYLLVECTDYDVIYRVLLFNNNIDKQDIQDSIDKIKIGLWQNGIEDWTVDDVLQELSTIYNFTDLGCHEILEV